MTEGEQPQTGFRHLAPRISVTWLRYAVIVLALAVFTGYLLVYLNYAWALFHFPFDYDQGEGFELVDTLLLSRGEWPYRDNSTYPFYSSNYPPLFHLLVVPLVWLFGPQYWTGRLVSFLATLITAGTIACVVQRRVRRPWLAFLSGLAFLASNYVYHVGPLFRLHMTMVMFETLAVAVIGKAMQGQPAHEPDRSQGPAHPLRPRARQTGNPVSCQDPTVRASAPCARQPLRPSPRHGQGPVHRLRQALTDRRLLGSHPRLWLGLILLLAAGFTKQTAVVTCAAVFAFLFLRAPRRAILLALPFAGVALGLFWGINVATDGHWWLNTIVANTNPWGFEQAAGLYRQWFRLHAVITLLAAGLAVYELYWGRLSIFTVWFAFSVAGSVMAGKWGAGESYFTTAVAGSCIVCGLGVGKLLNWSQRRHSTAFEVLCSLIPILFLLQARLVFHLPTHSWPGQTAARLVGQPTEVVIPPQTSCSAPQPARPVPYVDSVGFTQLGRPPTAADTAAGREIAAYIRDADGPPLSEEAGFSIYAGADVVTNPTQLLNLYRNGMLDMDDLLAMIRNRDFGVIILRAQFYPGPVLQAIGQSYQTVDTIEMNGFVYCVLRPRLAQTEENS